MTSCWIGGCRLTGDAIPVPVNQDSKVVSLKRLRGGEGGWCGAGMGGGGSGGGGDLQFITLSVGGLFLIHSSPFPTPRNYVTPPRIREKTKKGKSALSNVFPLVPSSRVLCLLVQPVPFPHVGPKISPSSSRSLPLRPSGGCVSSHRCLLGPETRFGVQFCDHFLDLVEFPLDGGLVVRCKGI